MKTDGFVYLISIAVSIFIGYGLAQWYLTPVKRELKAIREALTVIASKGFNINDPWICDNCKKPGNDAVNITCKFCGVKRDFKSAVE